MSGLSDVIRLTNKVFGSGATEGRDFANLMQKLLSLTVLAKGETVTYRNSIVGNRVESTPLKLNNGHFLRFFMVCKQDGDKLIIDSSSFQYQTDAVRMSKHFVFRYDYSLVPSDPKHPIAHLQLNGVLSETVITSHLRDVRFPVLQPTVESILRLLIHDFALQPNDPDWEGALKYSEDKFLEHGMPQLIAARR